MNLKKIILPLFMLSSVFVSAQDISEFTAKDYLNFRLPPLSSLFENAKASPILEYYEKKKQADESMMSTEQKKWLNYLKVVGGYQYGVIGNNTSFSDTNTPLFYQYSGNKQNWYNVGVSLSIPLDDLFDRKNRIKKQRLEMEATEYEKEKWYDEQKLRIVESYTLALKQLALLRIKSEALIFAEAQFKLSENDFVNNKITVQELNRQKSMYTVAATEYEETRAQLNTALLQLEILAKTKIISQ
mgnify:CR=1 FL=1